jgi:hypothetical protein
VEKEEGIGRWWVGDVAWLVWSGKRRGDGVGGSAGKEMEGERSAGLLEERKAAWHERISSKGISSPSSSSSYTTLWRNALLRCSTAW